MREAGMRILLKLSILLSVLPMAFAQGETARAISPFEGMTTTRISIVIGGALDLEGGAALRLFAGDRERASRFRAELTKAVTAKLKACGIEADDRRDDETEIRVYGRPETFESCEGRYIFLVEVGVYNSKQASSTGGRLSALRPVMGWSNDEGLERALSDATLTIMSEELKNCASAD
jgi:hypothetical protein